MKWFRGRNVYLIIRSWYSISINNFKKLLLIGDREYEKNNDKYCTPSYAMSSTNLNDAKKECTTNPRCHMFYDWGGTGRDFYSCDNTTLVKRSGFPFRSSVAFRSSILYKLLLGNMYTYIRSNVKHDEKQILYLIRYRIRECSHGGKLC